MHVSVESITWLSESAREAEIVLSSQSTRLLAFCHPCDLVVGSTVTTPIHAFGAREIQLDPGAVHLIQSTSGLAHRVTGTLVDPADQLISSCDFLIQVDGYLPGGLQQGDTVSFHCGRLDVW